MDAAFADPSVLKTAATVLGYAETYSILLRQRNAGRLDVISFGMAVTALENEVLQAAEFELLAIDTAAILAGISLMKQHNINSSDAAILAVYLRYSQSQVSGAFTCLLVASDKRFLRAAQAEGLATLNPEAVLPADVPALLAGL